jgi:hypothetical protein
MHTSTVFLYPLLWLGAHRHPLEGRRDPVGQRAAKEAASEAAAAAGDGFVQQLVAVHLLPVYFTGYTPAPFFVVRPPQQHAYYTYAY